MYSVVLMMAMTSGGDLPDLGHRHGGCCGGYTSCCGGYGYSCCGGYAYGGYSCCGGYVDYCGCCGGGRHHRHGCCGGYSCCGGYYYSGYSCCGCCGGVIYTGGTTVITEPGKPGPEPIKKPDSDKKPEVAPPPKPEATGPAPATIIVSLPADATLSIDDAATTSTSSLRVFTSPVLPLGRDFHYTLKAELTRDGKAVTLSKDVTVRAGEESRVNLNEGAASVASR
jgi:uncharacterized protein (TIGR03000 family)